jgi:hypothetical protein
MKEIWRKNLKNIRRYGYLNALRETSDGGYIAVGYLEGGDRDFWIVKLK